MAIVLYTQREAVRYQASVGPVVLGRAYDCKSILLPSPVYPILLFMIEALLVSAFSLNVLLGGNISSASPLIARQVRKGPRAVEKL